MEPQPAPILRTMEISDVIDTAIRLYRHNFAQLLGITAIVYVPVMGLETVFIVELMNAAQSIKGQQVPWAQLSVLGAGLLGVLLLAAVFLPLAEGACCIAVSELYLGRRVTAAEAYRRVFPMLGKLIWTFLLVGLFVGVIYIVGLVLCILPGIVGYLWAWTILLFAWPVAVLEGTWGPDALRRSQYLVKDYFWRILGTWIVLGLIVGLAAQAIAVPVQLICGVAFGAKQPMLAQAITQSVAMGVTLLIRPVNIIGIVLLYYDARIRKEGFDLQVMAAALGHDPTAYKAATPVAELPPLWGTPGADAPAVAAKAPEAWIPPPTVALPPRPGEEAVAESTVFPPVDEGPAESQWPPKTE